MRYLQGIGGMMGIVILITAYHVPENYKIFLLFIGGLAIGWSTQ